MGHKVTANGIYPDDRKVEAIKHMPFAVYLGKFVPNLSENTDNLRKLVEKDTELSGTFTKIIKTL